MASVNLLLYSRWLERLYSHQLAPHEKPHLPGERSFNVVLYPTDMRINT